MNSIQYKPRVVQIGDLAVGGDYPIRVQSMTSTPTMDTEATVAQSIRMIEAGCEMVRITAPGKKEAEHLEEIKKRIRAKGYKTPLIADIHYKPEAAEIAARIVEKVRINPGNYIDRKKGRTHFTEADYQAELERIRERIKPLIQICKQYGTAMRIGSNHGSLSERILLTYGDTPEGMVQSALEFVSICEDLDYHELVLSMKASNVKVMVEANRLLVEKMIEKGMNYPIHLGVTEAGDGEDGRIKSAAGIGTLLYDGIGDTIRVSLTEDPEFEIPVARSLVLKPNLKRTTESNPVQTAEIYLSSERNYERRFSVSVDKLGEDNPPVVILTDHSASKDHHFLKDFEPDYLFQTESGLLTSTKDNLHIKPVFIGSMESLIQRSDTVNDDQVLVFETGKLDDFTRVRKWFDFLQENGMPNPVILKKDFGFVETSEMMIMAARDFGYFLVDGLVDGIWPGSKTTPEDKLAEIAFGILQASRSRITKTEYIACPSCGRTLFNIQETLQRIRSKTSHLKGLKIGVMGCCVNGPGEMADADYGYVGAGKGKVTLYKGKKIMETGVPEKDAVDRLLMLIKATGKIQ